MFLRHPDFVANALETISELAIELLFSSGEQRSRQIELHRLLATLYTLYQSLAQGGLGAVEFYLAACSLDES